MRSDDGLRHAEIDANGAFYHQLVDGPLGYILSRHGEQ